MHPLRHWLVETDWLIGVFSPYKKKSLQMNMQIWMSIVKFKRSVTAVHVAFTFSCNIHLAAKTVSSGHRTSEIHGNKRHTFMYS